MSLLKPLPKPKPHMASGWTFEPGFKQCLFLTDRRVGGGEYSHMTFYARLFIRETDEELAEYVRNHQHSFVINP